MSQGYLIFRYQHHEPYHAFGRAWRPANKYTIFSVRRVNSVVTLSLSLLRDGNGDLRVILADVTGYCLRAALYFFPVSRVFYSMAKRGFKRRLPM
jgi:hypothetical protein